MRPSHKEPVGTKPGKEAWSIILGGAKRDLSSEISNTERDAGRCGVITSNPGSMTDKKAPSPTKVARGIHPKMIGLD